MMNRMAGGHGGSFRPRPAANPGMGILGDEPLSRGGEGFRKMASGAAPDPYRQMGGDGMGQIRGGGGMRGDDNRPVGRSQMDSHDTGMGQVRGGGVRGEMDHRPMGRSQMDSQDDGMNQMRGGMRGEMDSRPVGRSQMDSQDTGMGQMRGGGRMRDDDRRPMGRSQVDTQDGGMRVGGMRDEVDPRPMGRSQMDSQGAGGMSRGQGALMASEPRPMDNRRMDDRQTDRGRMDNQGAGGMSRGQGALMASEPRPMDNRRMDDRQTDRGRMDNQGAGGMSRGQGGLMGSEPRPMDNRRMDDRQTDRGRMDNQGAGGMSRGQGALMASEPRPMDNRRMDDRQTDRGRMDNQGGSLERTRGAGSQRREPMAESRSMESRQYDRDSQGSGMRADPDRRMRAEPERRMPQELGMGLRNDPSPRDDMMDRPRGPVDQMRRPGDASRPGQSSARGNMAGRVGGRDMGGSQGSYGDRRMDDRMQVDNQGQDNLARGQRGYGDGLLNAPRQSADTFAKPRDQFGGDGYMEQPYREQANVGGSAYMDQPNRGGVGFMDQPSVGGGAFLEQQLAQVQAQQELLQQQQLAAIEVEQLKREKDDAMLRATMLQAQEKLHRSSRIGGDGILGIGPRGLPGRRPLPAGRGGMGRGGMAGRGRPPSLVTMASAGRGKRPMADGGDRRAVDPKKPRKEPGSTDRHSSSTIQRPSRKDQPTGHQDGARRKTRFDSSPMSRPRDRKSSDGKSEASSQVTSKVKDGATKSKVTGAGAKDKTEVTITFSEPYDPTEPTGDVPSRKNVKLESEDEKDKETPMAVDVKSPKPQEISLTVTVNKKGRSVNDVDKKPADKHVFRCNICNVDCYNEIAFSRHMKGTQHIQKMKTVLDVSKQKSTQALARLKAEKHIRKVESNKTPTQGSKGMAAPAPGNYCTTCDKNYTGVFKLHMEGAEHQAREERRKAGCKICSVRTFNNYAGFAKHLQSDWHKRNEKMNSWPHCKLCDQRFKSPRKFVQHCKTPHHIESYKEKNKRSDDEEELTEMVTVDTVGFEDESVSG